MAIRIQRCEMKLFVQVIINLLVKSADRSHVPHRKLVLSWKMRNARKRLTKVEGKGS